jgi:hypothetical protein
VRNGGRSSGNGPVTSRVCAETLTENHVKAVSA